MKVKIEGVRIEQVEALAAELGVRVIRRPSKHDDEINIWIRPIIGSNNLRLFSKAGAVKNSLCLHAQYAFMARVLARWPHAKLRTWVNLWTFQLFEDGARNWTNEQALERERYDYCECTPEMIAELMRSPKELIGAAKVPIGTRIRFVKDLFAPADDHSPAGYHAFKGQTAVVIGHDCREGHQVRFATAPSNSWFGATHGEEFIVAEGQDAEETGRREGTLKAEAGRRDGQRSRD